MQCQVLTLATFSRHQQDHLEKPEQARLAPDAYSVLKQKHQLLKQTSNFRCQYAKGYEDNKSQIQIRGYKTFNALSENMNCADVLHQYKQEFLMHSI